VTNFEVINDYSFDILSV